ncbi:C40 family peptidase [Streptomyces sp. NPDC046985]|uniref:C40 family peptidase n=1 Tax=Streptomyces sp. NPDC046985 TaxID=3155377 RepID=UPI0033DDDEDB
MSAKVLRLVCTATVAAQAALVPAAALAVPGPPAPGRSAVTAPGATPADGPGAGSAPAAPAAPAAAGQRTTAALLTDLQKLYRQAEQATETYDADAERLVKQRAEADRLNAALTRARVALREGRTAAGRLARQQYQGGSGLSPYLQLLLARDPQQALDQGHVIGQVARERAATVARLAAREKDADGLARRAHAALSAQFAVALRERKARDDVRGRLHAVEGMLASLSGGQLAALAAFEQNGVLQAQRKLMTSGALGTDRPPTEAGERAVSYAVRQVGKPYQWGAAGPGAYDCSGLTSQAWGHAGTAIPRTSQQQWARLERVPLNALRPGDLVVYFPEATHVALYLGRGMVVQAPRPGAKVKVSPLAGNPVLGAVRPDPGEAPLRRYAPPKLSGGTLGGPGVKL